MDGKIFQTHFHLFSWDCGTCFAAGLGAAAAVDCHL